MQLPYAPADLMWPPPRSGLQCFFSAEHLRKSFTVSLSITTILNASFRLEKTSIFHPFLFFFTAAACENTPNQHILTLDYHYYCHPLPPHQHYDCHPPPIFSQDFQWLAKFQQFLLASFLSVFWWFTYISSCLKYTVYIYIYIQYLLTS